MDVRFLIHKLFELGAVKFGTFTLKSGIVSPIERETCRSTPSWSLALTSTSDSLRSWTRKMSASGAIKEAAVY